jgi:hypothetical protein
MSPSSPCASAVPLPVQCDPLLHAVNHMVVVGEEAMYVPCSLCAFEVALPPGQCNPVLHAVGRLVIVGEEAMDVSHFTMRIRSSFTWPV